MKDLIWIGIVVLLGITQSLQVVLLGAMYRVRGPTEAAYVSILGTLVGMSLAITIRALLGSRPVLPPPLDEPAATGAIAIMSGLLLILAMRGLPPGFALTGMLAVPYLLAASYLGPRIGVALFVAALITGQLTGGVLFDHFGALGSTVRPIDGVRIIGVAALITGVVLIRGIR